MRALSQEEERQILLELTDCQMVYLFGSASRGEMRDDSDVDIAFYAEEEADSLETFSRANKLSKILGRSVDLIDLSQASTVFAYRVLSHGKLLFAKDVFIKERFEYLTYSSYARLNEERAESLREYGEVL